MVFLRIVYWFCTISFILLLSSSSSGSCNEKVSMSHRDWRLLCNSPKSLKIDGFCLEWLTVFKNCYESMISSATVSNGRIVSESLFPHCLSLDLSTCSTKCSQVSSDGLLLTHPFSHVCAWSTPSLLTKVNTVLFLTCYIP